MGSLEQFAARYEERRQREAVIAEARTWLGTPFHHGQGVKGAGVDCLHFLVRVYENAGVLAKQSITHYSAQWHLHHKEEKYLAAVLQAGREVSEPLPGDVALFKFGHAYSHAGIVIAWPSIIHSYVTRGVELVDASNDGALVAASRRSPVRFFTPWVNA